MGYTTEFSGGLEISPALAPNVVEYINTFSTTRRMKRDVTKLPALDPHGVCGLFGTSNYGLEGEYYASTKLDSYGQSPDESVMDQNCPPSTQPGLWCQWVIEDDGKSLVWDGGEKFYNYAKWLEYVIENFIVPAGSVCNGDITWQGEESEDMGILRVVNNEVNVGSAQISYKF